MGARERLSAADLDAIVRAYAVALRRHREAINRLNVYPVPDGDTGTNMSLTVGSVVEELDRLAAGTGVAVEAAADGPMAGTCKAVSHGSLMGARGNSGVILSQILRGFADVAREQETADAATVVRALSSASDAAYGAVMRPVEGTILTVVRESAVAAAKAEKSGSLVDVLDVARDAATDALARTPELLPVLADAGVVDAGGAGFVLFLDAMLHVVDDRPLPDPPDADAAPTVLEYADLAAAHAAHGEAGLADLRYEVMYFLEAPDESIAGFKDVWATMGDSIVVVGGEGIWNCHIHTDDIGAAVEAGIDVGKPRTIRVTDLLEQVEEERWVREAEPLPPEPAAAHEPVPTAVVAVATGEGISRIFYSLGVQGIVTGGQTMNPSTSQILEAVEAVPADTVVILPNNKNIIPVAEQVDSQTTKEVLVVPTRGVAEGFASLLAYDPQASGAENVQHMHEAADAVIAGEVTQAVRESSCDLGPIAEGDWLGLCRDGIVAVGHSLDDTCTSLLDRLVTDHHEIVTIIEGEGASAATTRHVEVWLQEHRPGASAEIHHGGQPLYPYLFGIE